MTIKKKIAKKPTKKTRPAKRPKKPTKKGNFGKVILDNLAAKAAHEICEQEDKNIIREIRMVILTDDQRVLLQGILNNFEDFKDKCLWLLERMKEDTTDTFLETLQSPAKPIRKTRKKVSKVKQAKERAAKRKRQKHWADRDAAVYGRASKLRK